MRTIRLTHLSALVLGALLSACASAPQGGVDPGGDDPDGGGGGGAADMRFDNDAFWAKDPPLMYCGLDGGGFPPPKVPGGTPACPDDKAREGCPCVVDGKEVAPGTQAPCWPGLRANRNLGICKDGVTSCIAGEVTNTWARCDGYVLPVEGAAGGKEACQCFSAGRWEIKNLSPCFIYEGMTPGGGGAVSTIVVAGKAQCPMDNPPKLPTQSWSENTITVDCQGRFKLCYALKAGDSKNPMANDCELSKVCVQGDYTEIDTAKPFPPLPAWINTTAAGKTCATRFATVGGYGEMSVDGTSVTCDKVGPKVFSRVQYCPLKCNDEANKDLPECKNCQQGGGGSF
jgi:hypothetical protein